MRDEKIFWLFLPSQIAHLVPKNGPNRLATVGAMDLWRLRSGNFRDKTWMSWTSVNHLLRVYWLIYWLIDLILLYYFIWKGLGNIRCWSDFPYIPQENLRLPMGFLLHNSTARLARASFCSSLNSRWSAQSFGILQTKKNLMTRNDKSWGSLWETPCPETYITKKGLLCSGLR